MKHFFTFLSLLIIFYSSQSKAEWIKYTSSQRSDIYISDDNSKWEGSIFKMWILHDFHKTIGKSKSGMNYKSFDCSNNMVKTTTSISYSKKMGGGDVTYKKTNMDVWSDIVPGTLNDIIFKTVCKRYLK